MARALAASSTLGSLAFALAWSLTLMIHPAAIGRRAVSIPIELLPPPPAATLVEPPPPVEPARPASSTSAVAATPVPVPAIEAPAERTIENQQEMGSAAPPTGVVGGSLPIVSQTVDEVVNQPGTPAIVDKLPEPIHRVVPRYSDLAMQAQVEGLVVVHVLVDRNGRVADVQLHPKTHVPILDQAALDAAREWTFEPALVNGHTVSVWVAVPFRFKLR
jgi:protein TonB